jgi:uncharacterized membrane protein SpoIIM required for sporulation
MKQTEFIKRRHQRWDHYRALLKDLRGRNRQARPEDFPEQYRRLCNDLALARGRGYSLNLVRQLEQWVMEGHQFLYRPRASLGGEIVQFLGRDFAALVRREWRLVLICSLMLFGPMLWLFAHIGAHPEFVYRVLSPDTIDSFERMYGRSERMVRDAEDDFFMFAFYIMNNIGVALRTFAGGLVFGIGSFLILLFNGVQIGAVAAHLSFAGHHENFWTFVIGHGAFELPAIALAGVAGARMGLSLLLPGPFGRLDALRLAARDAVKLLYGVIVMLLLAAGLEAFWSASPTPAMVKYIVGGILWLIVIVYFALAGRSRRRIDAD